MIDYGDFLNAADGAVRGAWLLGEVLALHVGEAVFLERNSGIAALLGAVMH